MWGDVRYAARQLRRNPLFSVVVILLLAVGIGANALIFSCVNALLLRPLPVRDPQSLLLLVKERQQQVRPDLNFTYSEYQYLAGRHDLFASVIAEENLQDWTRSNLFPMQLAGSTRLVHAQFVSANYFSDLAVRPFAGRVLEPSDESATSDIPAVLSYQFWQSQFAGDRGVVGRTIRLGDHPVVVVGISSPDFHDLDIERAPDLRIPAADAHTLLGYELAAPRYLVQFEILVRLRPGVTQASAAAAVLPGLQSAGETVVRRWADLRQPPLTQDERTYYVQDQHDYRLTWQPAARGVSQLRADFSRAMLLLMSGVALLLLAVCANVAGLLLVRSEQRRREIAVRLSIGASRSRVIRQLLAENVLLAIPAAAAGLFLAYQMAPAVVKLLPVLRGLDLMAVPRALAVTPDLRVGGFTIAVALLTVLGFGLAPAWRGTHLELYSELKSAGRTSTGGVAGVTAVAVQIAVSMVLLVAALLLLRTFSKLESLDPGFDRAHIVEFTVDASTPGYSGDQAVNFFHEFAERVRALPGVRSAAYSGLGLMRGLGIKSTVTPEGVVQPPTTFLNSSSNVVTPGYFATMGIPLLGGRDLLEADLEPKPTPIVVNREFADTFFPHRNPVGQYVVYGKSGERKPDMVVVGVCGTAKYRSFREPSPPTFYRVMDLKKDMGPILLYVRTQGDPRDAINAVRATLAQIAPAVPLVEVSTVEEEVQNSLWQERLLAIFCGFFGGIAAVLAAVGLYATLAYSVARRSRELGIRIALGAQFRDVVQTVCGSLLWPVAAGVLAGLVAAGLLVTLIRSFLYGVRPLDPVSFVVAAAAILACAALAAAMPSLRASRTDPAITLRDE